MAVRTQGAGRVQQTDCAQAVSSWGAREVHWYFGLTWQVAAVVINQDIVLILAPIQTIQTLFSLAQLREFWVYWSFFCVFLLVEHLLLRLVPSVFLSFKYVDQRLFEPLISQSNHLVASFVILLLICPHALPSISLIFDGTSHHLHCSI